MIGLAMGSPWRRREVLAASLATAATLLTAPGANLRAQPARVRHEVHDPAAAPMLELYKRAIREMKRRPAWDPTSWWFQANIHWAPFRDDPLGCLEAACFDALFTAPVGTAGEMLVRIEAARRLAVGGIPIDPRLGVGEDRLWAKCPHQRLDFLPWHRLYLLFFERIVESVVGEPFALPYWNYLDPRHRDMPAPFRSEHDPDSSENPLFYPDRNPLARDPDDPAVPPEERPLIRDQDLQWSIAAEQTFFERGDVFGLGRGFSFQLESAPHNQVHGRIGIVIDREGQPIPLGMATPALAARDPIFWLHHANLDRLWEWWRTRPPVPGDTPRDPVWVWSLEPYLFATPDGRTIGFPAEGSLELVGTVYAYDTLEPVPAAAGEIAQLPLTSNRATAPPRLVSRSDAGLRVGAERASVRLDLELPMSAPELGTGEKRWFLRLVGVRAEGIPAGVLDVYLDVTTSGEPEGPPAGSFAFFDVAPVAYPLHAQHAVGAGPAGERLLEVTDRVRALVAAGVDPSMLRVTVKPVGATAPVTVERIELLMQ